MENLELFIFYILNTCKKLPDVAYIFECNENLFEEIVVKVLIYYI